MAWVSGDLLFVRCVDEPDLWRERLLLADAPPRLREGADLPLELEGARRAAAEAGETVPTSPRPARSRAGGQCARGTFWVSRGRDTSGACWERVLVAESTLLMVADHALMSVGTQL